MCGIVGYIGKRNAVKVLINGLQRLEYRGYDSAGLSIVENGELVTFKKKGKVAELVKLLEDRSFDSTVGIAHTRWATHGEPSDINAHPHTDNSGKISIVHNGIIENYHSLKQMLISKGYTFVSETDTEVLAVLIGYFYKKTKDLEEAVRTALSEVQGTFGIAVLSSYEPDKIIAARRGSPMIVGIGENEFIVASDAAAIIQYTRQVIYLSDNEMVTLNRESYNTKTIDNVVTNNIIHLVDFDLSKIEKGGFEHFMLKEIFEQPQTIRDSFRGRLLVEEGEARLGGLLPVLDKLREVDRIIITGCGTSWHAGLVGEYLIENLCGIPVEVEYASEFRYRNPIIRKNDIVIAISQSGETADTLAAVQEAKQKNATVLGIVNVVGSSIARETNAGVYIHAGPEIGVASTKAFTSQLVVLSLIALFLGRMRNLSKIEGIQIARAIKELPSQVEKILDKAEQIREIAREFSYSRNFLYLGRGYNFPVALEGALKLKEISYIHAEGYPSAEMKHGPIALIDENMPVVFIAPKDEIYDKVISNIEEVRSRKGRVIAVATENDERITKFAERVIYVPDTLPMLTPILTVIPLQLLAYYMAVELGCNVDQPRNLAKSVTVE
ncbi:glutamine--fructose-6-phosphate transaminase (isomerizing) [Bacteroidetes/Chlorobi group bacterium Naka2016]|jgi:glucosamine--fructose-6-phosphate aminotransferase (isomerizing)|nr:MAG: glutamine--fructose-6-phosphate transaminase (isomerizing) [Bacteroidetes/Chlorobi group bacterium Naka2016]